MHRPLYKVCQQGLRNCNDPQTKDEKDREETDAKKTLHFALSEAIISNIFIRTAPSLILGPSNLRTSEAPAPIAGAMQYTPLKPL